MTSPRISLFPLTMLQQLLCCICGIPALEGIYQIEGSSGHCGEKSIQPCLGFSKEKPHTVMMSFQEGQCFDFKISGGDRGEFDLEFTEPMSTVLPALREASGIKELIKFGIRNVKGDGSSFVLVGYNVGVEDCEMLMVKGTNSVSPKEGYITLGHLVDDAIHKAFRIVEEEKRKESQEEASKGLKRSGEYEDSRRATMEEEGPKSKYQKVSSTGRACYCPSTIRRTIEGGLYEGELKYGYRYLGKVEVYLKMEKSFAFSAKLSFTNPKGVVFASSRDPPVILSPSYDGKKQRFSPWKGSGGITAMDKILSKMEDGLRNAGMNLMKGALKHDKLSISYDEGNDKQIQMEFNGEGSSNVVLRIILRRGGSDI